MSINVDEQVAGLSTKVDSLVKSIDKLASTPIYPAASSQRTDEQGRVTAFMEESDEQINLRFNSQGDGTVRKSYNESKRSIAKSLRRGGYIPMGHEGAKFESVRDFVVKGLASHGSDSFRNEHREHILGGISKYAGSDSSLKKAIQGMSESTGADGGFTVMPEFSNKIIDRVYENSLFADTDNYTVSGNNMTFMANAETSRATGSRHGGLQGYWLGEGGTITKSKPTVRQVTLKLMKLAAVVYLSDELLADTGTALEQYISRKVAQEFNFLIGDSMFNGTGVGQPLGIGNAPSLVSVAKEVGQTANTLQTENITKMFGRFFAPNYSNAKWYTNQDTLPQLLTMTLGIGAAGVTTYMPPGGLSGAPYGTILGRPNEQTEFNATLGSQFDVILADLKQMLTISKQNIVQAVSMHVEFLTDQLALRFTMRLNGRPWENAPITPYKGTNTQSNFVTLDARA